MRHNKLTNIATKYINEKYPVTIGKIKDKNIIGLFDGKTILISSSIKSRDKYLFILMHEFGHAIYSEIYPDAIHSSKKEEIFAWVFSHLVLLELGIVSQMHDAQVFLLNNNKAKNAVIREALLVMRDSVRKTTKDIYVEMGW